jgi:hypothetical protein
VVSAPCPHVIDDGVVGVVEEADVSRNVRRLRSADAEEDILNRVGVSGRTGPRPGIPTESRTGEFTGPASMIIPDNFTPTFGTTIIAALPRWGTRVA